MKVSLLNTTVLTYVIIFIITGFISWFTLTFGIVHLIEGVSQIIEDRASSDPRKQYTEGWVVVISLCIIGIISLIITVTTFLAIVKKIKTSLRK